MLPIEKNPELLTMKQIDISQWAGATKMVFPLGIMPAALLVSYQKNIGKLRSNLLPF